MEVLLKSASKVTATLEQQTTRCGNVGLAQPLWSRKLVECPQRLWCLDLHSSGRTGCIGTGVGRNQGHVQGWREGARLPRNLSKIPRQGGSRSYERGHEGGLRPSLDGQDLCVPVFRRKGLTCRLKTGRGSIVLRGCRLESLGPATIMSATRRRWEFDEKRTAIRTSFLGCPPDRRGEFGVDELEDRVEAEPQDHVDLGSDAEFEPEIEAIVGALEPREESDTVEVLATWTQTRRAMNQEKLNRGLTRPVYHNSSSTSINKKFPKPDLA